MEKELIQQYVEKLRVYSDSFPLLPGACSKALFAKKQKQKKLNEIDTWYYLFQNYLL